jgi:hypothetical protein
MNSVKQSINYILEDQNRKRIERFDLLLDSGIIFEAQSHFTGIEWWNRVNNFPYPIRYHVEISRLMFGLSYNSLDPESLIYRPYNTLVPDNEGSDIEIYPISFYDAKINYDGCICFNAKMR